MALKIYQLCGASGKVCAATAAQQGQHSKQQNSVQDLTGQPVAVCGVSTGRNPALQAARRLEHSMRLGHSCCCCSWLACVT